VADDISQPGKPHGVGWFDWSPSDPQPPPPIGSNAVIVGPAAGSGGLITNGYSRTARTSLMALTGVLFTAAVLYRFFVLNRVEAWGLFFHGLPAVLAIGLIYYGPRGDLATRVLVGTTVGLLMAGTVAGEGTICVLIAAPFVYFIMSMVSLILRRSGGSRRTMVVLPVLALASSFVSGLDAAAPQRVVAAQAVSVSADVVAEQLAATPDIAPIEAGLLGLGFPQPTAFAGQGLAVGDQRSIRFSDGGTLTLEVVAGVDPSPGGAPDRSGQVRFQPVSDTTMIGQWIEWRSITFHWVENDAGVTTVTADVGYQRLLEPGWYFGPIVDRGMEQATHHLLSSLISGPVVELPAPVGPVGPVVSADEFAGGERDAS